MSKPCVEPPRCGRCGILSGNGYMSQRLTRQQYRIRQPRTDAESMAFRTRLVGWGPPPTFTAGWYPYTLEVCEKCLDAPVRTRLETRKGGKTWTLWEPENPPKRVAP